MLIGCGLRRGELLSLAIDSIQLREEHRVIVDLKGKGGHIRMVPVPQWVKTAVDVWSAAAGIVGGTVSRSINKSGKVWESSDPRSACPSLFAFGVFLFLALFRTGTKRITPIAPC
jgi:integrase